MAAQYDEREVEDERHSSYSNERKKEDTTYEREPYHRDSRSRNYPLIATEVVNISEKVIVPTKEYPKYNFLGKILGPKGSTLKNIASSTKSKISILGRGSSRDPENEEELSQSNEPEHQHLKEPLHVLIQVKGPKMDAHGRMAAALKEINKFMIPVYETKAQSSNDGVTYGERNPPPAAATSGPILRFGIPPPGAIIIGKPNIAVGDHKSSRREERSVSRSVDLPKLKSTDTYTYRDTDDRAYNGYLESKEVSNYNYSDSLNSRPGDKRLAVTSDYSTKKYREESYGEKSYSTNESDSYYSANYSSSRDRTDYY